MSTVPCAARAGHQHLANKRPPYWLLVREMWTLHKRASRRVARRDGFAVHGLRVVAIPQQRRELRWRLQHHAPHHRCQARARAFRAGAPRHCLRAQAAAAAGRARHMHVSRTVVELASCARYDLERGVKHALTRTGTRLGRDALRAGFGLAAKILASCMTIPSRVACASVRSNSAAAASMSPRASRVLPRTRAACVSRGSTRGNHFV